MPISKKGTLEIKAPKIGEHVGRIVINGREVNLTGARSFVLRVDVDSLVTYTVEYLPTILTASEDEE